MRGAVSIIAGAEPRRRGAKKGPHMSQKLAPLSGAVAGAAAGADGQRVRSSSAALPLKEGRGGADDDGAQPTLTQEALTANFFGADEYTGCAYNDSAGGSSASSVCGGGGGTAGAGEANAQPILMVPPAKPGGGGGSGKEPRKHSGKRHRRNTAAGDGDAPRQQEEDDEAEKEGEGTGESLAQVLGVLSSPGADEATTTEALARVKELLADDSTRVMAMRDGIVPALAGVYRMHPDNADAAQIIARILASCAYTSAESKIMVGQQGGVEMLLDSMQRFVAEPGCVVSGLVALTNVSSQDENHLQPHLMAGIPFVLSLLERYPQQTDICELVCFVLRNLSASKPNTAAIVEHVDPLVAALAAHTDNAHIASGACAVLLNIAIAKDQCAALCQRPVVRALARAAARHAGSADICQDAVAALANIAAVDAARDMLLDEGVVPLLAALLHAHAEDDSSETLCQSICWALRNLTNYKEACGVLWAQDGAVADLCRALAAHTGSLAICVFCSWSLCNLFAEHECPPDLLAAAVVPAMLAALASHDANASLKKAVLFSLCHLSAHTAGLGVLGEHNVPELVMAIAQELGTDANVCSAAATTVKQFAAAGCITDALAPVVMPGLLGILRAYSSNVIVSKEACTALWHLYRSRPSTVDAAAAAAATGSDTEDAGSPPATPRKHTSAAAATAASSSPLAPFVEETDRLVLAGLNNHCQDARYAEPAAGCLAELTQQSTAACQTLVNMNGISLLLSLLQLHPHNTPLVAGVLRVLRAVLETKDSTTACKRVVEQNGLQLVYALSSDPASDETVVLDTLCILGIISSSSSLSPCLSSPSLLVFHLLSFAQHQQSGRRRWGQSTGAPS